MYCAESGTWENIPLLVPAWYSNRDDGSSLDERTLWKLAYQWHNVETLQELTYQRDDAQDLRLRFRFESRHTVLSYSFIDADWNPDIRLIYEQEGHIWRFPFLPECYVPMTLHIEGLPSGPYLGVSAYISLAVAVRADTLFPIWVFNEEWSRELHGRPGRWGLKTGRTMWGELDFHMRCYLPHRYILTRNEAGEPRSENTQVERRPAYIVRDAVYPVGTAPEPLVGRRLWILVIFSVLSLCAAALCWAALGSQTHSFYSILRWSVFGIAIYCSIGKLCSVLNARNQAVSCWIAGGYALVAWIYNPCAASSISRGSWVLLDILTSMWFLIVCGGCVYHEIQKHRAALGD
jgi:hypothetical protein